MFFFRLLGMWLMLIAVVSMVIDGTRSLADNQIVITSLGAQWSQISESSLLATRKAVEQNLHPFVWEPLIFSLLLWPSWAILGLLGTLFYWTGRKRYKVRTYVN